MTWPAATAPLGTGGALGAQYRCLGRAPVSASGRSAWTSHPFSSSSREGSELSAPGTGAGAERGCHPPRSLPCSGLQLPRVGEALRTGDPGGVWTEGMGASSLPSPFGVVFCLEV